LRHWIAHYVNRYLNHLVRRHTTRAKEHPFRGSDPLDEKNRASLEWLDQDNEKEDADYQAEILFDPTNPEELLIAKETLGFAYGHFTAHELAYLNGEIDVFEAANKLGITAHAFRKRLDRRKADFRNAMKAVEYGR
jgi:hypothetical protein